MSIGLHTDAPSEGSNLRKKVGPSWVHYSAGCSPPVSLWAPRLWLPPGHKVAVVVVSLYYSLGKGSLRASGVMIKIANRYSTGFDPLGWTLGIALERGYWGVTAVPLLILGSSK